MQTHVERVGTFFYRAMAKGWVNGAKEIADDHWPGFRIIEQIDGQWKLTDAYCVVPGSPKSWGFTTIWRDNLPVWVMNYGGWYEKRALKFLKGVLRNAYGNNEFHGGRGESGLTLERDGKRLEYVNVVNESSFEHFSGCERILEHDVKPGGDIHGTLVVGEHEYWGMMLK